MRAHNAGLGLLCQAVPAAVCAAPAACLELPTLARPPATHVRPQASRWAASSHRRGQSRRKVRALQSFVRIHWLYEARPNDGRGPRLAMHVQGTPRREGRRPPWMTAPSTPVHNPLYPPTRPPTCTPTCRDNTDLPAAVPGGGGEPAGGQVLPDARRHPQQILGRICSAAVPGQGHGVNCQRQAVRLIRCDQGMSPRQARAGLSGRGGAGLVQRP